MKFHLIKMILEKQNVRYKIMDLQKFKWTREPRDYKIENGRVEIISKPHTDLWQRTYYHFQNDNAPVLQMETEEKYFSFVVKTEFTESHHRFDEFRQIMTSMKTKTKNQLCASTALSVHAPCCTCSLSA